MSIELLLSRLEHFEKGSGNTPTLGAITDRAVPETRVFRLNPRRVVHVHSIPEVTEKDDLINTLGWKVVYVNKQTKQVHEKTHWRDGTRERMPAPNGLHVFRPISSPANMRAAVESLSALFDMVENPQCRRRTNVTYRDPRFQMRGLLPGNPNNILFIVPGGLTQPQFRVVMRSLAEYDRMLHDFVMRHAHYCLRLMGSDESAFDDMQLQLVHYTGNGHGGLLAHIDAVEPFKDTIGPIFTVNMNHEPKAFDLLPTLKQNGTPAVRLITNLGEITMMDGESRIAWSHSIPFGNRHHAYTVAFKFPCQPQYMADRSGGYSRVLETYIPQNLAVQYREPRLITDYGLDTPPADDDDSPAARTIHRPGDGGMTGLKLLESDAMVNSHGVRVEEGKDMGVAVRIKRVGRDSEGSEYAVVRVHGDHDGGRDYTFALDQIVNLEPTEAYF